MKSPAGSSTEVEYPSSDGERMSENQWQFLAMVDAITMLEAHFADRPAHVTGDLLIYDSMIRRAGRIFSPFRR